MIQRVLCAIVVTGAICAAPAAAAPFTFNNGNVDGRFATATRPDVVGQFEIESADDFVLGDETRIGSASFIGLLPAGATIGSISEVVVEIYRVFPLDSTVPPSGRVPTRTNSPSDVALDSRDSAAASLTFSASVLSGSFSAANSILPGGIHASPNQTTGGSGAVSGEEVQIDATLSTPFDLAAGHYFFVPQVSLSGAGLSFLWLSSVRPIVAPGTPFTPDLQAWVRDAALDPDWLRAGTDVVGGSTPPTFNLAFSLAGETIPAVPEPETWALMLAGLAAIGFQRRGRS
ncbi:MAG TPA: PEP-CTERM sorting domain-containing protein [Caldimonas sp.]|nr:PEP-CTERM sorting domain-containing protein [Caldimonas sp.]